MYIPFLLLCRYSAQWYAIPLREQKLSLFLLQRGSKPFNLNVGGLFIASMESASMVRKYILHIRIN